MVKMNGTEKNAPLLSVRKLRVEYSSSGSVIHAVNGVSFDLDAGKTLGLVGETGAGKTTIAKSLMRILPDHSTKKAEGVILFDGEDIMLLPEAAMRGIRGRRMSMIFQDPMTSLNPVKTVINQIAESIRLHRKMDKAGANRSAVEILETVGISKDRSGEYPHQFSGGMKQRVVIALALACSPALLIADEPTTALDVTIQAQVLDLIARLRKEFGTAMILITHDLGVVADVCDTVAVIYAGEIVEKGSKEDLFDRPMHPYTKGLFAALPDLSKKVRRLSPIEGLPPDPTNLPGGCAFGPRCPHIADACRQGTVELTEFTPGHFCRCRNLISRVVQYGRAG
jgi:peptide/nickel transport system ATP-binding protein